MWKQRNWQKMFYGNYGISFYFSIYVKKTHYEMPHGVIKSVGIITFKFIPRWATQYCIQWYGVFGGYSFVEYQLVFIKVTLVNPKKLDQLFLIFIFETINVLNEWRWSDFWINIRETLSICNRIRNLSWGHSSASSMYIKNIRGLMESQ